eukprot:gene5119-34923_t
MQRYGPPPSYSNLKIPGLNAPIPAACSFGYQAGGWGKPPVDENGLPLYGDVFGEVGDDMNSDDEVDKETKWGVLEPDVEESSEEESDEEDEEGNGDDDKVDKETKWGVLEPDVEELSEEESDEEDEEGNGEWVDVCVCGGGGDVFGKIGDGMNSDDKVDKETKWGVLEPDVEESSKEESDGETRRAR